MRGEGRLLLLALARVVGAEPMAQQRSPTLLLLRGGEGPAVGGGLMAEAASEAEEEVALDLLVRARGLNPVVVEDLVSGRSEEVGVRFACHPVKLMLFPSIFS